MKILRSIGKGMPECSESVGHVIVQPGCKLGETREITGCVCEGISRDTEIR